MESLPQNSPWKNGTKLIDSEEVEVKKTIKS